MFIIYVVFTYIQFNKYTHPLIQTNKISHRGAYSEIVLRDQIGVVISENATTYYYHLNWVTFQTTQRHISMDLFYFFYKRFVERVN